MSEHTINTMEIPFPFNPNYKIEKVGQNIKISYDESVKAVRQTITAQWTSEPLSGRLAFEADFRVTPPKRTSKAVREAMLAGKVLPPVATKLDKYLAATLSGMEGAAVDDSRSVVLISGVVRYDETPGATLRFGHVDYEVR